MATYRLCTTSNSNDLGEQMLCEIRGGGLSEGEEAAYPARELGDIIAIQAPGQVDDLLQQSVAEPTMYSSLTCNAAMVTAGSQ